MSDAGGTLTFAAAIDLAELPACDAALPESGWLLFFVELYSEVSDGLVDVAPNAPGSAARVLFTEDVVEADPPDALHDVDGGILRHRPIVARRMLTLPGDYEAAERLGLDTFEAQAYEEVLDRLRAAVDPRAGWDRADHWIGDHVTGVQGHPPEPDTTLLLHLGWDEELGFRFQDGGAIEFRIPTAALGARDWSRAFAEGDSC